MRRLLTLALALALCAPIGAQEGDAQKDLATALSKFERALPGYGPDVRKQASFYRGLLKDFYLHKDELTASEAEVAEALLSDLGIGAFGSRGEFSGLVAKPAAAPVAKPAAAPPKKAAAHKAPPPPVVRRVAAVKPSPRAAKVSGLKSKPTFRSGSNGLGGDAAVGFVTLSIDGRSKRIVEVPGTKALQPGRRAATIASRLRQVAAGDPLWWMKLRTASERGEIVLTVPGSGVGHILTADRAFAKAWGETPQGLATRLRNKIRHTYDDMGADRFAARGGDSRDEAIDARVEGDEMAAANPEGAMELYRAAIEHDKTYLVPYLRIADLYRGMGKGGEADALLRQASEAEGMSPEDKKAALAAIKG